MKNTKNNEALMAVLAHVQAAARIMSEVNDERLDRDPLMRLSSADDELDFEEIHNVASTVRDKLCRIVPKLRLLIYTGAPKGTIYKKVKVEDVAIIRARELLTNISDDKPA